MNGTLYMFYALTTNHLPGVIAGTDNIPANGGDAGFNYLTNIGLRVATEEERAFFFRSGGVNREKTIYKFSPEVGGNGEMPNIYNKARLVVSNKPPNTRWDATSDPRVSFKITNNVLAVETVLQGDWIRGIIRYPFTDLGTFDVFTIDPAKYTEAISDCLVIGRQAVKELSIKGIEKIELDPAAQSINEIASGKYIKYYDNNLSSTNGSSSSSSRAATSSVGNYTGEIQGQTPQNIINKLTDISGILQKSTNFKSSDGTNLSLREAIQQKCGATMFNKLTFEATKDPPTCKKAIDLLIKYYIPFSSFTKLYECTLCGIDVSGCKPGDGLPTITSLAKFENPIRCTGFTNAPADASGVRLKINRLKLGNEFTYELQLNDVSDTADNSSKYIFNPLRFIAGKRNDESADINTIEIVINEYSNVIQIYDITRRPGSLLGEIQTPVNFKLYSAIKLQAIIYTFANKSYESNVENYSVSAIDQNIIDSKRYAIFDTDIYSRAATTSTVNFIYNDANTIQTTFTVGTTSRIVPSGNYTFLFSNAELGSFIDNNNLSIGQFNRILLNVLSGELLFMNNSTKVSSINTKFKEQANALMFEIALKDPTNTQTYYTGTYTAFGNRYPNTVTTLNLTQGSSSSAAVATPTPTTATNDKEVVFIETPVKDGIDAATATQLVRNFGTGYSIATIEQVVQAAKDGANWCSPGWCEFTDINGQKVLRAAYPLTSQLTDPKCITQDDSIALYDNGIVVVSTPTTLKANIMVYKKKEDNPVNLTSQNKQVFKQAYFNAMTGRWKNDSKLDIANNEIFAVTKNDGGLSSNEIANLASTLSCAIVTEKQIERQLEFIKGKGIPLPNITVVGWALDNSNMPIKIKLDGQFTKLPANTSFVNSLYCYGNKEAANGKLDTNIYTMQAYNAQLNIANQNDNIQYKPMLIKTKALIDKAPSNNIKGALLLKEIRETPQAIVREGFSASLPYINKYVGCDKDSYGCIQLSGSSAEKPAPPPLISKNGKFQIKEMQTSNGSPFEKPDSIAQGVQNVRDCQEAGGDIAITDETYPGCPAGYCCEPVEPADNTILDTSMFAETCDDSNSATAVEQCDDTEEVLPLHQQAFEPYKLTRVQRTKTPTSAKCSKPKRSKSLKEAFQNTPEYIRDVHQITQNERMFSLIFNRGY